MKVVNPGDWAREALQLMFPNRDEYDAFLSSLTNQKVHYSEIAKVNGTELVAHYLFIEGKQTLAYVQERGAA